MKDKEKQELKQELKQEIVQEMAQEISKNTVQRLAPVMKEELNKRPLEEKVKELISASKVDSERAFEKRIAEEVENLKNQLPTISAESSEETEAATAEQPQQQPDAVTDFVARLESGKFSNEDKAITQRIVNAASNNMQAAHGKRIAIVDMTAEQESEQNFLNLDARSKIRHEDYEFPGSHWDSDWGKYIKLEQKQE